MRLAVSNLYSAGSLVGYLILLIAIFNINCTDVTNFQPLLYIQGEVWRSEIDTNEVHIYLDISNPAGIPDVRANGIKLKIAWELSSFEFTGHARVDSTDMLNITIRYENNDGEFIEANVIDAVPSPFDIYCDSIESPETIDLIFNNDKHIYWTKSINADYYHIMYSLRYDYDTADTVNVRFSRSFNITSSDTSITLTSDMFTPDSVDVTGIYHFYGRFEIRSIAGPDFSDDMGNIKGDGIGFVRLYGWYYDIPFTISFE